MNRKTMNKQRKCYRPWPTGILAFVFTLMSNLPVQADDTEVYFGADSGENIRPNVLFIMDTSGSMDEPVPGDPEDRDRLEVMQDSLITVLDSISNVNVGLVRYSSPGNYDNNGGPVLFPIKYIDAAAEDAMVVSQVKKPADGAASDDAVEFESGTVNLDGISIALGELGSSGVHISSWGQDTDYSETNGLGSGQLSYADVGSENLAFRFPDVAVKKGMTVISANLIMQSNRFNGSGRAEIRIENNANPPTYSIGNNFDDRNYTGSITWNISNGGSGVDYTSPNIASLVQTIINKPGWNENQALAFNLSPVSGRRSLCTPYSEEQGNCLGPVLSIAWRDPNESVAQRQKAGLRFEDITVPQGATIRRAYIDFIASEDSFGTADFSVHAQKSTDSVTFTDATNDISGRGLTSAVALWGDVEAWQQGGTYRSADLSELVEEVAADPGWCGGNAMSFVITGINSRRFVSADADPGSAPKLTIEFDQTSATGGCTQGTKVKQIGHNNNDTESTSGPGGGNLDFDSDNMLGFRFDEVNVPAGAEILSARIELTTQSSTSSSMSANIYALDSVDPNPFTSSSDLSALLGSSSTEWEPSGWESGDKISTSDIKEQVKEIVDKSDWAAGNAMGFIINVTNGNDSSAYSYNSSPGKSARLYVTYKGAFQSGSITVRDLLKNSVRSFTHDGFTPIAGTLAEAALYFRGEGVKFGKVRGNPAQASFRTSHPVSYKGGTDVLPDGCPEWDSSDSDCTEEEITGSPIYDSPITDHCQPSHLLFLSDGQPNSFGGGTASVINGITGGSCLSNDSGKDCSLELAYSLGHEDQAPDHVNDQYVITSTVSFAESIQLMEDLATQGGGEFYQADNEDELVAALEQFVESALASNSSFASAGVSVNQFNNLTNDEELYFSLFQPSANVVWPGNLKRYKFDPETGEIVDSKGNAAIAPDGVFDAEAISFWNEITDGNDVGLGGAAYAMPPVRNVYTNVDSTANLSAPINKVHENNTEITESMLGVSNSTDRDKVLKWSRGLDINDSDDDGSIEDVRLQMGDPLHSQPVLLKYDGGDGVPSTDDSTVVFVGTNQGYLHAINASDGDVEHLDDGDELWAFIPKDLLSNLAVYQRNVPGVIRPYGLDGPITVKHNDTDRDGLIDSGEQVILYVAMRRGGRNYYAVDVSNKIVPKLLFEITGGTGDYTELGQSWSAVTPVTIKASGVAKQVIVFGGGYDVTQDTADTAPVADAVGRTVFVADALTGALLWNAREDAETPAAPFPGSSAATATLTASITGNVKAIDFDDDGFTDTLYATDTNAQVFRFDIDQAANLPANFAVGGRIAHLSEDSVAGNRRFYYAADPALVVLNNNDRFVAVSVGSGYRAHPLNQATEEHFYVLRDYGVLENTFDADISLSDLADVSEAATNESAELLIDASNGKGWMINLSNPNVGKPGEKVTAPSLTVNNTVVFSTYIPPETSLGACAPSEGTGRTWFVDILDGTPTEERTEDLDNPQLSDRHTPENMAGLPPGVIPFYTEKGLVLLEGRNVLEAPAAPAGDPLKVFRRRQGREPLEF